MFTKTNNCEHLKTLVITKQWSTFTAGVQERGYVTRVPTILASPNYSLYTKITAVFTYTPEQDQNKTIYL